MANFVMVSLSHWVMDWAIGRERSTVRRELRPFGRIATAFCGPPPTVDAEVDMSPRFLAGPVRKMVREIVFGVCLGGLVFAPSLVAAQAVTFSPERAAGWPRP